MAKIPRVFISYSHDSDDHRQRVLELAIKLRNDGCKVRFDQFESAPKGWTRWMQECLDPANTDYVLIVCTDGYLRRLEGKETPGAGLGVQWEGRLIYSRLYEGGDQAGRYLPILLDPANRANIPRPLFDHNRFEIGTFDITDPGYRKLYRYITDQPEVELESEAEIPLVILPPEVPARGGSATSPEAPAKAPEAGAAVLPLRFRLWPSDTSPSGYDVELTIQDRDPVVVPFACDPHGEKQTQAALEKIDGGECLRDDLCYVGAQLWSGLVHGPVQALVDRAREGDPPALLHVRLRLPKKLENLPWEALHSSRDGFLGTAERFSLIRDVPEDIPTQPQRDAEGRPVGVLVVMPRGSGLDLAAEKNRIEERLKPQGDRVRLRVLDGKVSPDDLREELGRGGWDVVHFAGHAQTNDQGEVLLRLNHADDAEPAHWMEAEVFATLFNAGGVRLVVFNCCRAATPYNHRGLGGLGPFLFRKGVPAVIAMRYDLPDPTALRFADEFYRVLFCGPEPGRVDLALEKARVVIYQNQTDRTVRDFVSPVLHLATGHERVFVLAPPAQADPSAVPPPPGPVVTLDGNLRTALLEGRCVPVLGPDLLMADAVRNESPVSGPRDLALQLAQASKYGSMKLFDLVEGAGHWLDATLLQWVCQHFTEYSTDPIGLFSTIQLAFSTRKPTPLIRAIASWKTPGYICTYFDGLLQQALQDASRPLRVVNGLRADIPPDPASILLVHIRGHWSDPGSLVLTEDQHNDLLDCLVQPPTRVIDLVRGALGRSLLFLGVDPRDPLIRRLAAKLLPEEHRGRVRLVGPVYFACTDPSDDDRAYWRKYKTVWLDAPLPELVTALTAALRQEANR
jgi:hypothetical protein